MKTSWILTIEEDSETGDALLAFPPDLLEAAGWIEGGYNKLDQQQQWFVDSPKINR
jgi:hypothetical protein